MADDSAPSRCPRFAAEDWLCLEAESVCSQTVIRAVLREAGGHLPCGEIDRRLQELRPRTSIKRIANITRRRNIFERTPGGLNLIRPEDAPHISGPFLWGPPSAFTAQEVASHRRTAIELMLKNLPEGLTKKEIAGQLRVCRWIDAPISIDTLREDFDFLVNGQDPPGIAPLGGHVPTSARTSVPVRNVSLISY